MARTSILRTLSPRLGGLALIFIAVCSSAVEPKRVLILDSFGRDVAPFNVGASSFRTTLARDLGEPVDIYEAPLDAARFANLENEAPFLEFLRSRFEGRALDLVVPIGAPAVKFVLKHRENLFPQTPVLFMGVEPRVLPPGALQTNTALVTQKVSLPGMVEDILQMQPGTTNIVVVFGASPLEKFWVAECRREFQSFSNRVSFTWLNDLPLDSILAQTTNLPPHSFILFGMMVVDAAGVPYDNDEALRRLHKVASAPIFGYFGSEFGLGAIGGRLYQDREVGVLGGRAAIRILRGESPGNIPPQILEKVTPVYDWRELRRWHIPETRLPTGSEISFRQPAFWETYHDQILAVLSLCIAEAVLIAWLVVTLRKRQRAERSLRESEERLQLATESAGSGLASASLQTGEVWVTPRTREMLRLPQTTQLAPSHFLDLIRPEDREAIREQVRNVLENKLPLHIEYRCALPDQTTRWIVFRGRVQTDPRGNPDRLMGVFQDVSERKQSEFEAGELRGKLAHMGRVSTLGALSGSLAHELNQPLGIILSNAQAAQELLRQQPPDLAETQEILSDIVAADRRAADVIDRLRALLKQGQVSLQPLQLNQLADQVLNLVQADLIARKVTVNRQWSEALPPVRGDRVQIQQLLLNLIINGADAMEDNPPGRRRLSLQTSLRGDCLRLSVRDEGCGLPENIESIFLPFHTTKPNGLGMGLAICRSIVAAHRGRLWAERHPEQGSVFHLELPLNGTAKPS